MLKPKTFYIVIGFFCLINIILNGIAIYRGLVFNSEQGVPGLILKHNALSFTASLIGTFYGSDVLKKLNLNKDWENSPYIFNYTDYFPTPNTNTLLYNTSSVETSVDAITYSPRCLQLETISYPDNYLFYGYTIMHSNGTGLKGNLCKETFNDPSAYPQMDSLCQGIACMRNQLLIGCIPNQDLYKFHISNCGRVNEISNNRHWSGLLGQNITLDEDPDMKSFY